jgi:putative sterol carrier protein
MASIQLTIGIPELSIQPTTGITELLTVLLPNQTKESIAARGVMEELRDTVVTMTLDVSGKYFSYKLTDGSEIEITSDKIDNAMVTIRVSEDQLAQMLLHDELDIILMVITELNRTKYETIKSLSGSFKAELSNDDGSQYNIEVIFNGATEPNALFKMKTSDSALMMRKEENPINLFMAGGMQIEGDMQFSMATQPLFV